MHSTSKSQIIRPQWQGALLALFSTIGYAVSAICSKMTIIEQMPLLHILFWRFFGMAFLLFAYLLLKKKAKIPTKDAMKCIAIGMFCDTLVAFTFLFAIDRIGPSLAAMLLYTYPIFVFLFEKILYAQSTQKAQWIALGGALVGAFFVIDPQVGVEVDLWGMMAGLLSGLSYAFYISFISRSVAHISPIVCGAYIGLGGALTMGLISTATIGLALPPTSISYGWSLIQIIFGTLIPLTFFYAGVRIIGPAKTAIIYTLEPVLIVLFSMWLFHERVNAQKIVGSVIVLLSIVFLHWYSMRKKKALSQKI